MKNLPRNLRVLFGVLRIVMLINLWLTPLSLLQFFGDAPGDTILPIGEIALQSTTSPMVAIRGAEKKPFAEITELRATAKIHRSDAHKEVWNRTLLHWTATRMVVAGWYFWLFTLLHRLCKRLELGEIFVGENIGTLNRIGWGLVGYGTLGIAAAALWRWFVRDDLIGSLSLSGPWAAVFRIDLFGSTISFASGLEGSLGEILLGGLVLLLTAAFRQATALKIENDLTV